MNSGPALGPEIWTCRRDDFDPEPDRDRLFEAGISLMTGRTSHRSPKLGGQTTLLVGSRIKAGRLDAGLSQSELAEAAGVSFQPQRMAVAGGKAESKVTFARPGTYTLRAYADDGIFITPADVIVTVK